MPWREAGKATRVLPPQGEAEGTSRLWRWREDVGPTGEQLLSSFFFQRQLLSIPHPAGSLVGPTSFRHRQRWDVPSASPCGGKAGPPRAVAGSDTCRLSSLPPGHFWLLRREGGIFDDGELQRVIFVKKSKSSPVPYSPARSAAPAEAERKWEQEAAPPPEFVCPISGAPMADPVILPSGQTYERACLQACADLSFFPPGAGSGSDALIPNSALRAAIGNWCTRSGRAAPRPPSKEAAREAVLRVMPPAAAAAEAKSVRTRRAAMAFSSNSSYSSPASAASTSTYASSSEITPAEEDVVAANPVAKEVAVDPLEDEVVATVMDADEDGEVAAALAVLREATRESAERRRALCTPRLLAAIRRVLLIPRHASARVDATAALVNLSLEPANKVRIVRAGAVPALVEVLRSSGSAPEAREHAAGALFGLALNEENRAAIGVLGAVPPLLDLLTSPAQHPRARRDAGMAIYHLSLAAVNQSKVARFPGAPKALLTVASSASEPTPIRRLALMVVCNVGACAEGRAALMDAGAVAAVSGILLSGGHDTRIAELEEWCVAAIYALSRGSLRFRGLARAAGADKALRRVAEEGTPGGVRREMARKTLRAMRGDLDDEADLTGSSLECGDGDDCGGSIVSDGLMSFRRRQRDVGVSSGGNTAEF